MFLGRKVQYVDSMKDDSRKWAGAVIGAILFVFSIFPSNTLISYGIGYETNFGSPLWVQISV